MKPKNQTDYFAELATAIPVAARPGLAVPARATASNRQLPWAVGATQERPKAAKLSTADQLKKALLEMRARFIPFTADLAPSLAQTRTKLQLRSFQWRVEQPEDRALLSEAIAGKGQWTTVNLPHYGPPLGKAATLYRAVFDLPADMTASECVMLRFLGVDYKCQAYLNSVCVGQHEGCFEKFEFNCTGVVRPSGNILLVRVENDYTMLGTEGNSREINGDKIYAATGLGYDDPEHGWHHCPPAMGVYNDVLIEGRTGLHIGDLWVRPLPKQESVEVRVELENLGPTPNAEFSLSVSIFGQNFEAVVHRDHLHRPITRTVRGFGDLDGDYNAEVHASLGPGTNYFVVALPIPKPRKWSPEEPWLYQAQVRLLDPAGRLLDAKRQQFGMRSFVQDETSSPRGKFLFNDREIRLRGANTMGHLERCIMRGDFEQLRDDILLAKLTHLNFLRLTQRPVNSDVYEWCDRLGLMLQTDMPLFATVRRNQFFEVVRQCSRMERHVRAHASNVIISFINEPRPAAGTKPHRFLLRNELERLFAVAIEAVRHENPDRVIKCVDGDYDPPAGFGMPDNHCYCGWYIGHGVDLGALHRGDWLAVKPGWYYGCGEFGSEALDSYGVMQRHYPEAWKPASPDTPWTPQVISKSQSWNFHFLWYQTPRSARGWIEASQGHQAWVTRLMTEALRRKAEMNTFAIHLFIDAWPCGWMKTIMDVDRIPKKAWFAYRDALEPLAISLRSDRTQVWSGETIPVEVWVCNDHSEARAGCELRYDARLGGKLLAHGSAAAEIDACAPRSQGAIHLPMPEVAAPADLKVGATLLAGGKALHDAEISLKVFPREAEPPLEIVLMDAGADAHALAAALGSARPAQSPLSGKVLLFTDHSAYAARSAEVDAAVRGGATAVFLKLPPGEYQLGGAPLEVRTAGMGPRHFVSIDTGHPLVKGFAPDDFKFWHFEHLGYVAPILRTVVRGPAWTPVLQSGDGRWTRTWEQAPAAVERSDHLGLWRVCQIELAECVRTNPAASIFARRLLTSGSRFSSDRQPRA